MNHAPLFPVRLETVLLVAMFSFLTIPAPAVAPRACRPLAAWLAVAVLSVTLVRELEAVPASRWETLEAIHSIENPRNRQSPGSFGELGAYQFRASTWKMHTKRPFREALDRAQSDEVAIKHYEWIKAALERNGLEVSTYNIALAWNAGVSSTINHRAPASSHDYARRVSNLATQLTTTVASSQ